MLVLTLDIEVHRTTNQRGEEIFIAQLLTDDSDAPKCELLIERSDRDAFSPVKALIDQLYRLDPDTAPAIFVGGR